MSKKILVLGGTSFIGRNLVEKLIGKGEFEITLFNRGITNQELFSELKSIKGDRETEDIHKLFSIKWDYIIDLSCFYPNSLNDLLNGLKHKPKKYVLISTCSVYDNEKHQGKFRNESAPTLLCSQEQASDTTLTTYGNRKAQCERVLINSGIKYAIFRPALVFGKYDPTDRLYFWLNKLKNQETLLLPENGERQFSMTYVDDLVNGMLVAIESNETDQLINAISYPNSSIRKIVETSSEILNVNFHSKSVTANYLHKKKISQWFDMPLWISSDDNTYSNELFKSLLGKTKICPFDQALEESIAYYNNIQWPQPKYGMDKNEYETLLEDL